MARSSRRLTIEPLEDRTLMSTCHVTRLTDQGIGKGFRGDLRYCINKVNAEPGADAIDFTVAGTINLTGALPDLSSEIDIQGPGSELLNVRRSTGGDYRIFTVTAGAAVSVADLTASGGKIYLTPVNVYGGAIFNAGLLVLHRVAVEANEVWSFDYFGYGGGIHNHSSGDLTLIECTISDNLTNGSSAFGGGISNFGTASIYSSTIVGNRAGLGSDAFGYGGGIYNRGILTVYNSTIASNIANDIGPGLALYGGATSFALISHSTIHGNDGFYFNTDNGVWVTNAVPFFMRNTIVAGHVNGDIVGTVTASDHNLIGNSTHGVGFGPTDILDVDPLLGPLADNGGPTPTMALLPGSPAIDAGDNADAPEWDQRGPGFPRIVNGTIDIGAFEVQTTAAPIKPDSLAFLITADFDKDE